MKHRMMSVALLAVAITACTEPADPVAMVEGDHLESRASSATDPLSNANRLPESLEQKVKALRTDMEGRGYRVARGYWTLWGADDCKAPMQTVGFCYGNNPTAPYVLAVVPNWKDEHVDQELHHALLKAQRNMSAIYRLDHREALVVMAKLPPPARYLGLTTNVFTRETTLNESDPIYQLSLTVPLMQAMQWILFATSPVPSRMMLISSIGDATNNVNIQDQSGSVWAEERFFIITPDRGLAAEITAALVSAGVPSEDVFTEEASPDVVRPGLGPEADDFITYLRYALPDDPAAGEQWRKELPLTVLRVRDANPSSALDPFPLPPYDERTFTMDERDPSNGLSDDLGAVVAAVKARWGQPDASVKPYASLTDNFDLVGQHCLGAGPDPLRGPMDCLGDNQDDEPLIGPTIHLEGDTVVAMVGTLATETGNATYVSLSVNWFPYLVGVQNLSDVQLTGTAAEYLEGDRAHFFYVYYIARDCTGIDNCLEVPRKLVPAGESIKAIVRNYVTPGSARGPDPTKLLMPRVIFLDGSQR